MAGPALPVDVNQRYPGSTSDESIDLHQRHHDLVHRVVNAFDLSLANARTGDVLRWNGASYAPAPNGRLRVNRPTSASYTLTRADADGTLVAFDRAEPCALVVPPEASVPLPVGTCVSLAQLGPGQVTVEPAAGVSVNGTPGLRLLDRYSGAELVKVAPDSWWVVGRLSA